MLLLAHQLTTSQLLSQLLTDCKLQQITLVTSNVSDSSNNIAVSAHHDSSEDERTLMVSLPACYQLAADNYISWLQLKSQTAFDNSNVELSRQALQLANYLEDNSYWQFVSKQILANWNQLAVELTSRLNDDSKRQLYLSLPHPFLPNSYRYDSNFIHDWLQHKLDSSIVTVSDSKSNNRPDLLSVGTPTKEYTFNLSLNKQNYQSFIKYGPDKNNQPGIKINTLIVHGASSRELQEKLTAYQFTCQLQQLQQMHQFDSLSLDTYEGYDTDEEIVRHYVWFQADYNQDNQDNQDNHIIASEGHLDEFITLYVDDDGREREAEHYKYLGIHRYWFNGLLIEESTHSNDYSHSNPLSYHGPCKEWTITDDTKRQLVRSANYLNDKLHGAYEEYFSNGRLKLSAHCYKDCLIGQYQRWIEGYNLPVECGNYSLRDNYWSPVSYKTGLWTEYDKETDSISIGHYESDGQCSVKVGNWASCKLAEVDISSVSTSSCACNEV